MRLALIEKAAFEHQLDEAAALAADLAARLKEESAARAAAEARAAAVEAQAAAALEATREQTEGQLSPKAMRDELARLRAQLEVAKAAGFGGAAA